MFDLFHCGLIITVVAVQATSPILAISCLCVVLGFIFPISPHFAKATCGWHFCLALSTVLDPLVGKCRSIWPEEVAHSEKKHETEDAKTT